MNAMPIYGRFPWLPVLAIGAFSGALFLCDWLVWTPMQRYYLGSYLKCALFATDPPLWTQVRWLYKTAPHGKKVLVLDDDVVPASLGGDHCIPLQLSPAARQAGWTGLMQGPPDEWYQTARLQPFLRAQYYAGESIWRMLLTPLLWGASTFFFLLAMWSMWQSRSQSKPWAREMIEWGELPPTLLQRWRTKIGRIGFRLPRLAKQRMPSIAPKAASSIPATAPAECLKKPMQPVLALFGAPAVKPKEGLAWEETKGIE